MPPNQSSPLEPNQADQFAQQLAHNLHYLPMAATKTHKSNSIRQ
jgi:hypothetical protein